MINQDGFQTKDSGARETWATGSQRDTQVGKGRYDLLPAYCVHRVSQLYERGAIKYNPDNWRKGMSIARCMSSLLRHAFQYLLGMRDEDHLAAIVWNAFTIMWTENRIKQGKLPKELDDLMRDIDDAESTDAGETTKLDTKS